MPERVAYLILCAHFQNNFAHGSFIYFKSNVRRRRRILCCRVCANVRDGYKRGRCNSLWVAASLSSATSTSRGIPCQRLSQAQITLRLYADKEEHPLLSDQDRSSLVLGFPVISRCRLARHTRLSFHEPSTLAYNRRIYVREAPKPRFQ